MITRSSARAVGVYNISIPASCTVRMEVGFNAGWLNRLSFFEGRTGQPVLSPVEGRRAATRPIPGQLENNTDGVRNVIARGQHQIPGDSTWQNDTYKVLSKQERPDGNPLQIVIGYEDFSDNDYSDIMLTLHFEYQ